MTATIRSKHSGKIQSSASTILQYLLPDEIWRSAQLKLATAGIRVLLLMTRIRGSLVAYFRAMACVPSVLALSTIV
jgi:hypothetical protein